MICNIMIDFSIVKCNILMIYKLLPSLITGYDELPILRTVSATPYCARAHFCLHLRKPGYQVENRHCIEEKTINNNCPVLACPNDSGWNDAIDDNDGAEAKDDDDEDENDGRDGFAGDGAVS